MKSKKKYNPNKTPLKIRVFFLLTGSVLVIYTIIALAKGDLYIFGTRGKSMHLQGLPMWLIAAAFFCAAGNLFSDVIDHLDERDNEKKYVSFRKITWSLGWLFFIGGLVLNVVLFVQNGAN